MSESKKVPEKIPEEFSKVVKDFTRDIRVTFPEVSPLMNKWWKETSEFDYIEDETDRNNAISEYEASCTSFLFGYCQKKFPLRFFEILYQNDEMFKEDSTVDTEFLPHIHFKNLWQFDITQKTRDTIWKYLQLILFSVVGTLENRDAFGDTAKLFEAINEDEFKTKLEETLKQMEGLFDMPQQAKEEEETESASSSNKMPNANDIHDHISGMLDGQLGKLAKEIAEETAQDLNMDMENVTDMKDVFNNLIKNPTKLMGLVKNVGEKLDTKIKSGDIKESELIAEATEIMNKMKNMPGMDNIQSMLSKMGMPGLGGKNGGKVNMSAMEAQMSKNMKNAKMKERMKEKHQQQQQQQLQQMLQKQQQQQQPPQPSLTDEQIVSIFSTGEKVERTPRGAVNNTTTSNVAKKKKGKK
jgi:hypothetical protein